ncbi:MAG: DUF3422 family protein [Sphingobium sp.]
MRERMKAQLLRRSHPQRLTLTAEMHNRKLPPIAAPTRLVQIVLLADAEELETAAACFGENAGKHAVVACGDACLVWERHSEFVTYSFIVPGAFDDPFDDAPFAPLLEEWLDRMPGEIIRSSFMAFERAEHLDARADVPGIWFNANDLVVCDVHREAARIWSDFRMHGGFGRTLVSVRSDEPRYLPELAQSLLELGNYRKLALLGLPVAQTHGGALRQIEKELAEISHEIDAGLRPPHQMLHAISELGSRIADIMASTRYRMSATSAYAAICEERVHTLDAVAVDDGPTLAGFTQRRLSPAVKTCASFVQRLDDLAQRIAWTAALLRTRVDTEIASQNRDLLRSLDRRNAMQLRLQQTVEGLSVAAISYYVVGLFGYLFKSLHALVGWPEVELAGGLMVVPICGAVAWMTARVRHGHQ